MFTYQLILFRYFHVGRIGMIHDQIDEDRFSPKYLRCHHTSTHMDVG